LFTKLEIGIYLKFNSDINNMPPKKLIFFALLLAMNMPVFGQYDTGTYYSEQDPYSAQYTKYSNFGISFEYPTGWQTFESSTVNPSEGDVSIQSNLLVNPMDFLKDTSLMGAGSLQMITLSVSWSKTLANKGLDGAMNLAISNRRQEYNQMNVKDLPSIIVDGNTALVKKIDGIVTDGYSEAASYEFLIVFISSKTNRAIDISSRKTFRDFQDSDIEYLKHLLSNWTEAPITYDLGMPLAGTQKT